MLKICSSILENWFYKILRNWFSYSSNINDQAPLISQSNFLNSSNVLGIIAGNGLLPIVLADNFTKRGVQYYIAALEGEADPVLYKNFPHQFFRIGMVKPIINYFREHNVNIVILAGGVNRPNLQSIKVDLMGSRLIARILKQKFLGDDKILSIVIYFIEEKGFKVVSSYEILSINNDIMTLTVPSVIDNIDIELGTKLLNSIGCLDVGQSVIVDNGYIIGVEAAEGTDNLIKRCSYLRKNFTGGVLIKMMKRGQDTRVDIPTIGLKTITNLVNYGYKGLAIEKNKVIIIELKKTLELANKCGIFIKLI